jgi:hypothetical protein
VVVKAHLAAVAATLNSRPRKTLESRTPAEALNELLRSHQQGGVATTLEPGLCTLSNVEPVAIGIVSLILEAA